MMEDLIGSMNRLLGIATRSSGTKLQHPFHLERRGSAYSQGISQLEQIHRSILIMDLTHRLVSLGWSGQHTTKHVASGNNY
jgi:hypothetical protein